MIRRRLLNLAVLSAACLTGCVSQDQIDARQAVDDYVVGDYPNARRLLVPLAKKTNEDFALNNCRLGSTTLAMYDLVQSQAAFLQAYEVLNSFGVNNGGRTLGAVLVDEKIKIWRGEPFERAMANFYLGLTYYMQGDYNNARGAFENALFKLRDYQTTPDANASPDPNQYRDIDSNFVLGQYMLARCYQRLGEDQLAAADFKRVAALRPSMTNLADVELNRRSNVLLVIDYGDGPRKATNGDGSVVGFVPGPGDFGGIPRPVVAVDNQPLNTDGLDEPLVDLVALSQDRKWQSIDTIRVVKSAVGSGLIGAGAVGTAFSRNQTNAEVGLGLIAAGILLKLTSQADTRVWEMLPHGTFAIPLTLSPGTHDVTVSFYGRNLSGTWRGLIVPPTGEATYYFRVRDGYSSAQAWPPSTLTGLTSQAPAPARQPKVDLPAPP